MKIKIEVQDFIKALQWNHVTVLATKRNTPSSYNNGIVINHTPPVSAATYPTVHITCYYKDTNEFATHHIPVKEFESIEVKGNSIIVPVETKNVLSLELAFSPIGTCTSLPAEFLEQTYTVQVCPLAAQFLPPKLYTVRASTVEGAVTKGIDLAIVDMKLALGLELKPENFSIGVVTLGTIENLWGK